MNIQNLWKKALSTTKIIRPRVKPLSHSTKTSVSYIFLGESKINHSDTVVRKGDVVIEKPQLILPNQLPVFENFDFSENIGANEDSVINFFLVRGILFPSLKYQSKASNLEVFEGPLNKALEKFSNELQRKEDVATGLVTGDEESWLFSVLLLLADVISKGTHSDIRRIIDDLTKDK